MGWFDWRSRKNGWKSLSLDALRREEARVQLREQQTIARLESLERRKEEIFAQGANAKSPLRRRQFAREFHQKGLEISLAERELGRLSKESLTLSSLRLALDRRQLEKGSVRKLLETTSEAELATLLEDDKVTYDLYLEKLQGILATLAEPAKDIAEEVGREGAELLEIWQKMDEGEIDSSQEGLEIAEEKFQHKQRRRVPESLLGQRES